MAVDPKSNPAKPASGQPGGRTTPVLVPQEALAGQPDIPLDRPVTTVGSNDSARLHLVSRTVSKGHALLVNSGGVTYIADLASRTGVLVNGRVVRDTDLKTGDRIQIGKFVFRYRSPSNAAPPAPAAIPPAATVIVVGSPGKPIQGRIFQIGRRENSDVCFPTDSAVSAGHAVIFEMDGQWYLRDLGSRTGTLVNGKPIHQHPLKFGDRIVIGSSTILFQPGVETPTELPEESPEESLVESLAESPVESSESEPILQEEPEPAEIPLVEDHPQKHAVAIPASALAEEDAIPLAEETPASGLDWKSALPASEPEETLPPFELEQPAAEKLAGAEDAPLELEPLDDSPIPSAAQPPAVEPLGPDLAETSIEDLPAPEPLAAPVVEEEPIPVEAVEQTSVPSPEPVVEQAIAFEQPAQATEPGGSAAVELPGELEPITAAIPEASPEPVPVIPDLRSPPPALSVTPEVQATPPVEQAVSTSEPDIARRSILSPVLADLVIPVEDFVFVPGQETADTGSLPDVMFWGDDELDFATEQAITSPPLLSPLPPPAPVALEVPAATSSEAAAPSVEEPAFIATEPPADAAEASALDAAPEAVESLPAVENTEPAPEPSVLLDTPSPAEISEASPALPPPAGEVEQPAESAPPPEPLALTEPVSATEPAVEPEPPAAIAEPHLTEAGIIEAAAVEDQPVVIEPSAADIPADSIEPAGELHPVDSTFPDSTFPEAEPAVETEIEAGPVVEPAAEHASPFVEASEAEQEISLLEEQPTAEISLDPLSDSFPLVEPVEEVAFPQELHSFANASADAVPHYEPPASASSVATEASPENLAALPVAEEFGSAPDDQSVAQFIDIAAEPDGHPVEPASPVAVVTTDIDEPLDLTDLEFIEPDTAVTQTAPVTDFSGVSTVDEIPAGDLEFGEDPADAFEEISGFEPLGEEAPQAIIPPQADEPVVDLSGFAEEETPEPPQEPTPVAEISPTVPPAATPTAEPEASTEALTDEPVSPPAPVPDPSGPATGGPSIFGFPFEGGSFLGGMPISLRGKSPAPEVAPEPAPPAAPPSPIFDARATPPSGIGEMLAAPPVAPPVSQPPRSAPRPTTPPRPARAATSAPSPAPASLSGLISDAHVPWAAPPVIPPVVAKTAGAARKGLTSNFTALDQAPRIAEVFSQMSAPIGVEVFGGRPGDPNQFTVPDTQRGETAVKPLEQTAGVLPDEAADSAGQSATATVAEPDAESSVPGGQLKPAASSHAGLPPVKSKRKSRLPLLLVLCVILPAILAGLIWKFVPISAQVVGSLPFEGLLLQQPADVHAFHLAQEQLLWSDEVRNNAQTLLQNQNLPLGFTGDDDTYHTMVASEYLNWKDDGTFQLTSNSTNEKLITAQVNAVLTALAQKDHELDDARNSARAAATAAKQALDDATAKVAAVDKQHREMADKAQDYPDPITVSRADDQRDQLNQQWLQARNLRQSSEKALAELRSQNPAAVIDVDADPAVKALQGQLQPLLDQITKLKGTSSADATTQPDTNPLIAPLQQQADLIAKKLEARRADITAEASISPEQRAVDQSRAVEDLSVKITALQNQENQAKTAADEAAAKANAYDARVSAAKLAGIQAEELLTTLANAQSDQKRAADDSEQKEAALASCITVKGPPTVTTVSITDMRPKLAAGAAAVSWIVLGFLIAGELRRPKKVMMTSVRPAAAPLVNPPMRITPWPQPRQNGEQQQNPTEPPVMAKPKEAIGV